MSGFTTQLATLREQAEAVKKLTGADSYIVYVTSTREPSPVFGAAVATDVVAHLAEQLKTIEKDKKLVLLLHTNGGDLAAPWPMVSLLREYCKELQVVVVSRALSAGTLISIAADKIYMNPDSFLSPVDPQAQVIIKGQQMNVEVEDVTGYIEFAKNKAGLAGGAGLEKAFENLTNQIPPTIIGSMFRTHALIRSLAAKMLNTRNKKIGSSAEKQIIEHLTEKLFSHKHLISRSEAKTYVGLGDSIIFAQDGLESAIETFASSINEATKADQAFNPAELLQGKKPYSEEAIRAMLFSSSTAKVFKSTVSITQGDDGPHVNVNDQGWVKEG